MANRGRRNRRRGHGSGGGGSETGQPQATVTAPRRQRRTASRRRGGQGNNTQKFVVGIAAVLVLLVGFAIFQVSGGAGSASSFSFEVYQGQEVLGGDEINFNDLLDDGHPIVLNFWAGNCPPCRAEMPALQRVYDAHKDEIGFVGLDVGVYAGESTAICCPGV